MNIIIVMSYGDTKISHRSRRADRKLRRIVISMQARSNVVGTEVVVDGDKNVFLYPNVVISLI